MDIKRCLMAVVAIVALTPGTAAASGYHQYSGVTSLCTGTCASFAWLEVGSVMSGLISIQVGGDDSFELSDIGEVALEIFNPAQPPEPYDGTNLMTANPLPIGPGVVALAASGGGLTTGGTTDEFGDLVTGYLLFEFLVSPLSDNNVWMIFDLATGEMQICLSFEVAGCIPGATQAMVMAGHFQALDVDLDGVFNDEDNCTVVPNPTQRDSNDDDIGNACDPDLNNDCIVNFADLSLFRDAFFSNDADADLDGDNAVNFADLSVLKLYFFDSPGPSSRRNPCHPEILATENFGDGGLPHTGSWSTGFGGAVVADAGDEGPGDHAMLYSNDNQSGLSGFHFFHPVSGIPPNPAFQYSYTGRYVTDIVFRARHSGIGDEVVLRAVLFDTFVDGADWAQTIAAVMIPPTATSWQTYILSLRAPDLVAGGQNGIPVFDILTFAVQIGLRHDPLGTGPGNPSPVAVPTAVWFDDIALQSAAGP